jgi:ABC-type Na+ efflux pump permease subunit
LDFQNVWTISLKEFKIFRKKKSIIYTTMISPLLVGFAIPLIFGHALVHGLSGQLNGSVFIFALIAATIPTPIAAYSLVGEKVQKTLEPLLATPLTDGEILLGKVISVLLLSLLAIYASATIFMVLMDQVTSSILGYLYFPNWNVGLILLVMVPLVSLASVELNVILSASMNDVRSVQQLGGILVLPLLGIFAAAETGFIPVTTSSLLVISAIVLLADIALFYLSKATFRREDILTKWK